MTLTFPSPPWPQNPERVLHAAQTILDAAVGALQLSNITDYGRQVITHGITVPIAPEADAQLIVSCAGIFLGKPGEQQYQGFAGAIGKFGFFYARYLVTVARKFVTVTGGLAPTLPSPKAQSLVNDPLWRDAWIVWSAMIALSLGGITPGPSPNPVSTDQMMVGPMVAADPKGNQALWQTTVEVQL